VSRLTDLSPAFNPPDEHSPDEAAKARQEHFSKLINHSKENASTPDGLVVSDNEELFLQYEKLLDFS